MCFKRTAPSFTEPGIDLSKLLTISRAFEQSHFQAQEMEQPLQSSNSINAIRPRYNTEDSGGSRRESPSHFNGASQAPSQSSTYNLLKQESTRWRVLSLVIAVATQATVQKIFGCFR